jgi:prepilin-type N-terminal cleavage/methylation domain-containing protein
MNRTRQRGFTLIELMVALLVSSLLVGMILAIFSRMSLAYRGQQQIAGVQQILAAARATIELDAQQAGLGMPQGFKTEIPGRPAVESPVQVTNSSTAPDQVAFFYADTSLQALVSASTLSANATITVADPLVPPPLGFTLGMPVVLTTASTAVNPLAGINPDIATYDACVLRIASIDYASRQVTFDTVAPWGSAPGPIHCTNITATRTMMYRFVAHAYRIDPTPARLPLGALQQSVTGNLTNAEVWNDLAYGFSDIQTAVRVYEPAGSDLDNDGDPVRNWYSSANQDNATTLGPTQSPVGAILLAMTISLVAHTDRNVEGIATLATPNLIGPPAPAPPNVNNNAIGDRASTPLPVAPPWPDPLLPGQRIYRWTRFQIDFRNLGVGVGQ